MGENIRELISMLNVFCNKQTQIGCCECNNNDKCIGDIWINAQKEMRELKILEENEVLNNL